MSGAEIAREGEAMFATLFPNQSTRRGAARRLLKRAHALMGDADPALVDIGFFLFGMSQAARGARHA